MLQTNTAFGIPERRPSVQKAEIWDQEFSKCWFTYANETCYNWSQLIFFLLSLSRCDWATIESELLQLEEWLIRGWIPVYLVQKIIMQRWDVQRRSADLHLPPPAHPYCLLWEESFLLSSPICPQRFMARCWARRLELDEKCPPARYMKVWNCRLLFALGRVPQKVFLLLLTERAECLLAGPPHPPPAPDCFCFQVTSYLLLQLFQFLRACCMKTESFGISRSLGNVHKPQLKDNPRKKEKKKNHWMCLPFMLGGHHRSCHCPSPPTSPPLPPMQLHQMNNQRNVWVH